MNTGSIINFITDNIWLVLLAASSGAMLMWPQLLRGNRKEVGTLEATQMINHKDAVILDVREDSEFAQGHLPNAKHIPLKQLTERLKELEKFRSKPVIVNCRTGARSARACSVLKKHGFEDVSNLAGGMNAWSQAGLPIEK